MPIPISLATGSRPEVEALLAIENPIDRAGSCLVAMEGARELMEEIARVRGQAIYEVYKVHGATKAARLFGTKRANIYRIVRPLERNDPEVQARRAEQAAEFAALMEQVSHRFQELNGAVAVSQTRSDPLERGEVKDD